MNTKFNFVALSVVTILVIVVLVVLDGEVDSACTRFALTIQDPPTASAIAHALLLAQVAPQGIKAIEVALDLHQRQPGDFEQLVQAAYHLHRHHAKPLYETPRTAGPELKRIRVDTLTGMAFSSLISLAIVFATAATLHAHGITDIETSSQAAEALRPIAGDLAFALFALGIIGTGMLAVPVLAGSAAYAITEMMGRTGSLASKPMQAKFFYGAIAATTLVGGVVNMGGLDPAKALYWAAVVNGVLAAPLMAVMMLIVRNEKAMGELVLPHRATLWGWAATAVMAAATAIFFWFLFVPA